MYLFNNFTTNEDIATKFEADFPYIPFHFSHNERTPTQISLQYLYGVRIIKEMPGSVASGTPCIIEHYVRLYEGMYNFAPAKEAAALTLFMAWLRAC
jgi:hypothetical protein